MKKLLAHLIKMLMFSFAFILQLLLIICILLLDVVENIDGKLERIIGDKNESCDN